MPELVARTAMLEADIQTAAAAAQLMILHSPQFRVLDPAWVAAQLEEMHQTLKQFHRRSPLLAGLSKEELREQATAGRSSRVVGRIAGALKNARRGWRSRSSGIP